MFKLLEEKVAPFFGKLGSNVYMTSLRDGMAPTIPLTIIASIFMIAAYFPVQAWTDFLGDFANVLNIPSAVCMGILALVVSVSIAYSLAKRKKVDPVVSMIISLAAFVLTCFDLETYAVNTTNFGAGGMFTAILIAIFTVKVFEVFIKHNLTIRMPSSVPPAVANSFTALIPGFVVLLFVWILTFLFGLNINGLIQTAISPLVKGVSSMGGITFIAFLTCLLWVCGINGESVLSGVTTPIFLTMLAENQAAFAAHEAVTNITAYGFYYFNMWLGGGCTMLLGFLMIRSKAKSYRTLGKMTTIPSMFCIAEPTIYGFPLLLNPVMMIPMILIQVVTHITTYLAMSLGWVNMVVMNIPWTTPPIISGFLATGGDIRGSILQIVNMAIALAMWYPFFKVEEKRELKAEAEVNTNDNA